MSRSDKSINAFTFAEGESVRWRHIKIRPTRLGLGMLVIAAASWIMALNYSVNLAYALAFWIFSFAVWAMLQAILQLYGSNPQRIETEECFAGESASITVMIHGEKLRERRLYLRFVLSEPKYQGFTQPPMQQLDTADESHQTVRLYFPVPRRGIFTVPVLQLYTHAPFALLSVYAFLRIDWHVTVYPAPLDHPYTLASTQSGEGEQVIRQGREDVAYLSAYQAGDPLKQVAWKQYAKNGKLFSKQMEEEVSISSNVISYRDYPASTSRDALASYLCHRVLLAEQNCQHYTLDLPQEMITTQNGQRRKALSALSVL